MITIDCEQLSPEWYKLRAGVPSASNFDKLITSKGETSKQRIKYMYTLAGESIIGEKEESYQNAAMQRGIELEAEARGMYDLITGEEVTQVGFCMNDKKEFGCSPDGLVGEDGLIEIKCPVLSTQVEYLIRKTLPTAYLQQVQGQLFITERKWLDFVSYYPAMNPLIVRVLPDIEFHKKLAIELNLFCAELKEIINKIQ